MATPDDTLAAQQDCQEIPLEIPLEALGGEPEKRGGPDLRPAITLDRG